MCVLRSLLHRHRRGIDWFDFCCLVSLALMVLSSSCRARVVSGIWLSERKDGSRLQFIVIVV